MKAVLLIVCCSLGGCARAGFHQGPGDGDLGGGADTALMDLPQSELPQADTLQPDLPAPQVTTIAGDGQDGFKNGPALSARFTRPHSVGVTKSGGIVVVDTGNHAIRMIDKGQVTTLAGTGQPGFVNGPGASAQFKNPAGLAIDGAGRIYVADDGNHAIRMIDKGQVTTFAGSGQAGFLDGPVGSARFNRPHDVTIDGNGVIYVADRVNHRIRRISNGAVGTLAGTEAPGHLDGPVATARFATPMTVHLSGTTVHVGEYNSGRIRAIAGGQVSTLLGSGDAKGYIDGPVASARLTDAHDIVSGGAGQLLVADQYNHCVRMIAAGTVSTVAGDGTAGFADGPLSAARFNQPVGLALDGERTLYVADGRNNRIRRISW